MGAYQQVVRRWNKRDIPPPTDEEYKIDLVNDIARYEYHGNILNALTCEGKWPLDISISDLRATNADERYIVTFRIWHPFDYNTPYYTVPCEDESTAWDMALHFHEICRVMGAVILARLTD